MLLQHFGAMAQRGGVSPPSVKPTGSFANMLDGTANDLCAYDGSYDFYQIFVAQKNEGSSAT